jgi:hypothetical protein
MPYLLTGFFVIQTTQIFMAGFILHMFNIFLLLFTVEVFQIIICTFKKCFTTFWTGNRKENVM